MRRTFRVGVTGAFHIRHALGADLGPESIPHGHLYRIEWVYDAEEIDNSGFAVDIARMEKTLKTVLDKIDGVFLNELPFFQDRQPSLEHVAVFLSQQLHGTMEVEGPAGTLVTGMEVKIWESDTAWASYKVKLKGFGEVSLKE